MVGYKVITSAVRAEGTKWRGFADTVGKVNPIVKNASLGDAAFFVGDPVTLATEALNAKLSAKDPPTETLTDEPLIVTTTV